MEKPSNCTVLLDMVELLEKVAAPPIPGETGGGAGLNGKGIVGKGGRAAKSVASPDERCSSPLVF